MRLPLTRHAPVVRGTGHAVAQKAVGPPATRARGMSATVADIVQCNTIWQRSSQCLRVWSQVPLAFSLQSYHAGVLPSNLDRLLPKSHRFLQPRTVVGGNSLIH